MPNAWDNVFEATFPVDPATGHRIADAVVALGSECWYCPTCGVLYSRDEGATSAPPHPNPLEPDARCTGTPTAGLWIPDDPEEGPA